MSSQRCLLPSCRVSGVQLLLGYICTRLLRICLLVAQLPGEPLRGSYCQVVMQLAPVKQDQCTGHYIYAAGHRCIVIKEIVHIVVISGEIYNPSKPLALV